MRINNEFTVHAPIDRAWALLTDVEAIAPCMPGAQLTGIRPAQDGSVAAGDEIYEGKVKVKLGPVVAEYKGTALFIEKDDEKYRGVIDAKGRDSRGAGNASALITVQLREDGEGTTVAIDTELKISGKIAQFGAGMIQEVSEKLLGQFVGCLEGKLAPSLPAATEPTTEPAAEAATEPAVSPPAAPRRAALIDQTSTEPPTSPAGLTLPSAARPVAPSAPEQILTDAVQVAAVTAAADTPVPASTAVLATATANATTNATTNATAPSQPARTVFQPSPEPEALDLLDLAGGAAAKRLVPMIIAGVAAVAAIIFFFSRR